MKNIEYSKFATVTMFVAQWTSGLLSIAFMVGGIVRFDLLAMLLSLVFIGVFFAIARILNLKDPDSEP